MKKKNRGRPRSENPASVRVGIPMTEEERKEYKEIAQKQGYPLAVWIKRLMLREKLKIKKR